ncbi:MAG: hypothetical protein AB8B79_12415 [Granulosicoccus sp.]
MTSMLITLLFIDGVFSPKINGQLRFHRVNAPTSKELNALVATISGTCCPVSGASGAPGQGRPARGGRPSDEQSDHLTLALDDEEGNTMQQLLRPLDHVSDSVSDSSPRGARAPPPAVC